MEDEQEVDLPPGVGKEDEEIEEDRRNSSLEADADPDSMAEAEAVANAVEEAVADAVGGADTEAA